MSYDSLTCFTALFSAFELVMQEPFTGTAVMKNGVSGFGLWVNPNGVPNRAYFMGHC